MRLLSSITALALGLSSSVFASDDLPVKDHLYLWLRADKGVQQDEQQRIAQWQDQSSQQLHAGQSNPDLRPVLEEGSFNGHPAIRFNATGASLLSTQEMVPLQQWTLFIVAQPDSADYAMLLQYAPSGADLSSSVFHLINGPSDGNGLYIYGDSDIVELSARTSGLSVPFLPPQSPSVLSLTIDGYTGNTALFRNGERVADSTVAFGNLRGSDKPRPFHIGAGANGGLNFKGAISEVIIYDSPLDEAERRAVEAYLARRYGVR